MFCIFVIIFNCEEFRLREYVPEILSYAFCCALQFRIICFYGDTLTQECEVLTKDVYLKLT
jgi:hypothetical protein